MREKDIGSVSGAEYNLPGQIIVPLSFLKAEHSDENGVITDPEIYKQVIRSLTNDRNEDENFAKFTKWFRDLRTDVKAGKRTALIEAGAGVVIFLVAGVAGYKFGVERGIDLRKWINNMNKKIRDAKKEKK